MPAAGLQLTMSIPFHDLKSQYARLKPDIDERIQRVLEHAQFILGPEVKALEDALADFTGSAHCVTCASGTEALLMALMALGIGPGDEVITPTFTFIATAEVIVLAGATPVFVDVEEDTCNLDVRKLERVITPRTKAIMPVALYGQPADMAEIEAIAARRGIPVIEDAAQSFGALYRGRASCNLSAIGCTSFFPTKPLGCYGDGGALFTNDAALAQALREIRVHGQSRRYHHTRIGVGGRMDTLQCAVVLAKLARFREELQARQAVAARYDRLLARQVEQLTPVVVRSDRSSAYAQYTVKLEGRDGVQRELEAEGIPTAVHYPSPIHRQPAYERWSAGVDCPVSESLAATVMSLPMHADLDAGTQDRIVEALARALASRR
jgi:UDP-2-acetamido-2-deoxy-ribo-hexuluronate aminotransferase